jgi:hypothetical protein
MYKLCLVAPQNEAFFPDEGETARDVGLFPPHGESTMVKSETMPLSYYITQARPTALKRLRPFPHRSWKSCSA